jgi:pimeloyl-ACP methyl ester carboxylesterase
MSLVERVERIRVNGLEHAVRHFEIEGASPRTSARTILLLHGFLDAGSTWDLVAAPLAAAGHRVVAPDLRGFGLTDRVGSGGYYHFPDYVADVDDLVRALAPERLVVVGHSMGGGVATLFTGARPDRVERLVVLEGLGPMSDPPELGVDRFRRWLDDRERIGRTPRPLADLDEATARLAATHPRIDRAILRSRAERLVRRDDEGRLVWAWDPLHRTTSPTPFRAEIYASFLQAIACPTLYVGGGPLGWHPPDLDERLRHIRSLERFDVPDAGHMMHWTAPLAVASRILEFLEGMGP